MRIKKICNLLPITAMFTGLILASTLVAPLSQSQNMMRKASSSSEQSSSRSNSVVTDEIDFRKIKKNNFSWKDDYGGTNGYVYTNLKDKNITAFTINSNGFTVNTSYPKYSVKTASVKLSNNTYFGEVAFQQLTSSFNIKSQTYDPTTNTFGTFSTLNSKTMYFGNTDSDTFSGFPSYSLNRTRPYMQFVIPIVSHKLQHNRGIEEGCGFLDMPVNIDARNLLRRANNRDQVYNGNANVINDKIVESGNHQNPGGMNDVVWHWHSELASYNVTISIFNNYDLDGNLVSTHMFNHGKSFNTVLPTVSVDETKLNKQLSATSQNVQDNGFVTLNNGQGVLEGVTETLTTEADDVNGTLKITYKPEFIFLNGVITKNTTNKLATTTITGFALGPTNIMARDDYPGKIVIDKWRPAVTDADGNLDPTELAKYLQLIEIPDGSVFTFSDFNPNLVTGELKFKIKTDKYYDWDMNVIESDSRDFEITLNLTPRITHIVELGEYPKDLYVDKLYPILFDGTGFVNLDVLNKYAEIIAPVDNANYYLVPDSYDIHTGDGTATFKLYADEYYDAAANQNNGAPDIESSHFTVTLGLKPLASVMQVKAGHPTDLRVDKFITSLGAIADDGVIADPTILKQYIDLENIPSTAQYKISEINYADFNKQFIRNDITFDLTVTAFNQVDATVTPQTRTLTLTLGEQHMTTDIVLLDASLFPKDATPTKFKARMEKDGAVDTDGTLTLTSANIEFLSKFLDFNSIPKDTVYTFTYNPVAPDAINKLGFNLVIDQYYDANSDLLNITKDYTFVLDLASDDYVPQETNLTTRKNELFFTTEQEFLAKVYTSETEINLDELDLYVEGLETIPTNAEVLSIKHKNNLDNSAVFIIGISGYYDGKTPQMQTAYKEFNFEVGMRFVPVPFDWWWILVVIGVLSIAGVSIWVIVAKRKQAEVLKQVRILAWLMTIKDQHAEILNKLKWLIDN